MDRTLKRVMTLYGIGIALLALVGIAYAQSGAACHATWKRIDHPDGSATYLLYCVKNDCPHECEVTGDAGFGTTYSTCKCDLITCNAAIRNVAGQTSEEQCLGGCTNPLEECPDVEGEPWVDDGFAGGDPRKKFTCDCP